MMWRLILICNFLYCAANEVTYSTYTRSEATEEQIAEYKEKDNEQYCTINIKPCSEEEEWRRLDGSCNNLNYPSHGTIHTPEWRMLPANFSEDGGLRKMVNGEDFPLSRPIRLALLKVGEGRDPRLTTAVTYFLEYTTTEFISAHDTDQLLFYSPNCCDNDTTDELCAPNYMTNTDYVHRFSGERCINMTKPLTLQNRGCTANAGFDRVNYATPAFDLSAVYYFNGNATLANASRTFEGGELKTENVNNITLPSAATEATTCFIPEARETNCERYVANVLPGTNIVTVWFWRHHNYLARKLAKLNSCWNDDTLFNVTKKINTAFHNQMMFYELYGTVLGKEYLIEDKVLGNGTGFRDHYDDSIPPAMSTEFIYMLRWFHSTQDGIQRMYDKDDNFVGTVEMANFSLRVQDFPYDDNMLGFTHGLYNQHAGSFGDRTIHPNIADLGLGQWQRVFDPATNDLEKGRYSGLAGYVQYRDLCTNYEKKHETFEDLEYLMDNECIELLKEIYDDDVNNVEMMAGCWCENLMKNSSVPPTVYYVISQGLNRTRITDRYWHERGTGPGAFTLEQLEQIQTTSTFASLLCAVGDEVSKIQPQAFLIPGPGNEKVSCSEIPSIDLTPWKDDTCNEVE